MAIKSGREGRRIKTKNKDMVLSHPYQQYMTEPIWHVVSAGIEDLVNNGDLIEQTDRNYIVGYLCKLLLSDNQHT